MKPFREAVRLESPGEFSVQVLTQPLVNQVNERGTDRIWIHRNGERHPVDKLRIFREIELVPVEKPEHPLFDELTGRVEMHSPFLNRWLAKRRRQKALEES